MLDTYALIELFNGSHKGLKIKKLLEKEKDVYISALCLFELGYVLESRIGEINARDYLRSIRTYYKIIDVNEDISLKAVELKRDFKLPAIDCLIYATVKNVKGKIVSGCKHFKGIANQKDVIIV